MKINKKSEISGLDQEEKLLLSSFENNEWRTVKNVEKEKARAHKIARKTLQFQFEIKLINLLNTNT